MRFLADTDVTLSIPLLDETGAAMDVSECICRVVDESGVEVVAPFSVIPANGSISVTVPAAANRLAQDAVRGIRSVKIRAIVQSNTVALERSYVIEASELLVVGRNSFQTLANAKLAAMTMSSLKGWPLAQEGDQVAALIEAHQRICTLRFRILEDRSEWGQSYLGYVPEGVRDTKWPGLAVSLSLADLTPDQFVMLPVKLRAALNFAQVAEADHLLDVNPIETKRLSGIIVDTVGESKQMFRTGKPLSMGISRSALRYLLGYVSLAGVIGRA